MPAVKVQNLCREYAGVDKKALDNISFRVENGEVFVIIGPNGSGKTTLLRTLDLLDEPSSGIVLFDGNKVNYHSARNRLNLRRRIGMVFQQTVFFNTSVFDNVAYGLKVRDQNGQKIRQRVREVLELVLLNGFEQKNALALSGGEAQRVALAQALVTEPELLLLDEPTANLDPRSTSIIEEALLHVNQTRKTTMIMATHNLPQAKNLAHKIAVLNEGKIEKVDTFHQIFATPSKFLVDFARLENVFSGVSKITDEGTSLIDVGNGTRIEAAFERVGDATVYVRSEDIILSTQLLVSSARNTFEGRIMQVSDIGPLVLLKVRAGKDFTVQITKRSFNEMRLNLDSRVFLAFKASSVQAL